MAKFAPQQWMAPIGLALLLVWPRTSWDKPAVWESTPSQVPGAVPSVSRSALETGRTRYLDGDLQGAIAVLTPWLGSRRVPPFGRERVAGHLLLGTIHMELENWNLASSNFYQVRKTEGPLASYGAWFEALTDHQRGRHYVAIKECKEYRQTWPDGPEADECLLLTGDAYSAEGARNASIESYSAYLQLHPDTPRKEEIRVAVAMAEVVANPQKGIVALHNLALHHTYPSTDLAVQEELTRLAELGHETTMPSDSYSLRARCESLRKSGQFDAAWALFQELAEQAKEDPSLKTWVEENEERFARGTRNYDIYATQLQKRYEERPSSDLAWQIFRSWGRAGDWENALKWSAIGETEYPNYRHWRQGKTEIAWATMLGNRYAEAADRWEALSKRGGRRGRKAKFYAGFCQLQNGNPAAALTTLEPVRNKEGHWRTAAHYWSAKAHEALGDEQNAEIERAQVKSTDRRGWYTLMLKEREIAMNSAKTDEVLHDGTWPGRADPNARLTQPIPVKSQITPERWPHNPPLLEDVELGGNALLSPQPQGNWAALSWDQLKQRDSEPTIIDSISVTFPSVSLDIPTGYQPSAWFDPDSAQEDFYDFAEDHKELWPDLPAAHDLALAGLYDKAARLVFPVYEEWRDVNRNGVKGNARRQAIANLQINLSDWRPFLCLVQDHYHASLAFTGAHRTVEDPEERKAILRLAYPVVFGRELYEMGQLYNVDPLMIMAIMRQESTYRNAALSPVGAIGLIQVMPSTGARVARLLGEDRYSPGDLEKPMINLRYGTYYFSQLMERFDQRFPMAVASYNGGPHNLSRWYKGKVGTLPMDVLVEQIMYDETRDYVKKVSGHYSRYVELYGEPGARVDLSKNPAGDDPAVIDF